MKNYTQIIEIQLDLLESANKQNKLNLDEMMCRLKDLSVYSLTNSEILYRKEGIELLALAMFFGMSSDSPLRYKNQKRLNSLSNETFIYQGQSSNID